MLAVHPPPGARVARRASNPIEYDGHARAYADVLADRAGDAVIDGDDGPLNGWRHARLRAPLQPFVDDDPRHSWLTVGDGRYGSDGVALSRMGAGDVHCTDLTDTLLAVAHADGLVARYSKQNAEALDFDDDSFDYVYCKESLHHFPRPYVALEQMFRVARRAVILCEPRDVEIDTAPLQFVLRLARRLRGRGGQRHEFEPVGNYIYAVSEREMEKFLLGRHHPVVAFQGINDYFLEAPGDDVQRQRRAMARLRFMIGLQDAMAWLGIRRSRLLCVALFKQPPSPSLATRLGHGRWRLRTLPRNPYRDIGG